MGTPNLFRILSISPEAATLTLETSFFPGRSPERHIVRMAQREARLFEQVLAERPFGTNVESVAFIESLTSAAGKFFCSVRVASSGKRVRQKIEVSAETFGGLQGVFNSNIISDGYVDV
jgi:hypothetical protein